MPIGLDNALQIAKSALHTNQYLINVEGQNIANANNKDYTRKVASQQAKIPITNISPGSMGTGVKITEIKRVLDKFVEAQLVKNKSEISNYETVNKYFEQIERIFNNFSDSSLNGSIDNFWNAWLDLSNNPSDPSARVALLEKSKNLEEYFHSTVNQLEELQRTIDSEIQGKVDKINSLTDKIASLNDDIFKAEINKNNHANDLRDNRDKLIKELAQYIDISTVETNGKFNVYLSNGDALVTSNIANKLTTSGNIENNNFSTVFWQNENSTSTHDITNVIKNGELKALINLRDSTIKDYLNSLNKVASTISMEVNKLHSSGVGLETFTSATGTTEVKNSSLVFASEKLAHPVSSGSFSIVVYDSDNNATVNTYTIGDTKDFDTNINSLDELITEINNTAHLSAQLDGDKIKITSDSGYSFAFAKDSSGILSALGVNTFFKGKNFQINNIANVAASKTSGTVNIDNVSVYNKNLLTGDNYTVTFSANNIEITDTTTGKNITDYSTSTSNGKFSLQFKGIIMQFDSSTKPTAGTYSVHKVTSTSAINLDNYKNHVLKLDFSTGTNNISIFDVTDNKTLLNDDYTISEYTSNGENYKLIYINSYGVSATIKDGDYGVLEISPEFIAGKEIDNNITDDNINFISSGKIDINGSTASAIGESDNRRALEIADLKDSKLLENNSETITENVAKLISQVGIDSKNAKNKLESLKISEEGLLKQRENVSGVSIDEEMTNLIQIQHSYVAAAKLLSIVDQLVNTLLTSVR